MRGPGVYCENLLWIRLVFLGWCTMHASNMGYSNLTAHCIRLSTFLRSPLVNVGRLESAQNLLADESFLWLEGLELGHISRLDTDVSFLPIS
jgi:hypothetical protein